MRSNKLDLYARITISKLFDKNTFFVYFNNVNGEIKPQYNLREFQPTEKQKKMIFAKINGIYICFDCISSSNLQYTWNAIYIHNTYQGEIENN